MIDSHAHLTSDPLFPDIDGIIKRAKEAGVSQIVNICTNKTTLERGLELAKRYPCVVNTASTTPHDVEKEGEMLFSLMAKHAREGDLVAVGETGLDYYYEHSDRKLQQTFLRRYLALATECDLPVVIHCRDAFEDLFSILDEVYKDKRGVLHCFTGTLNEAKEVIKRGWYLSLSGIVTFKRSEELREVATFVPLNQLLIETDSPYLAPQSKRGKQNEPANIREIAEVIAKAKGMDIQEVINATSDNCKRLFNL